MSVAVDAGPRSRDRGYSCRHVAGVASSQVVRTQIAEEAAGGAVYGLAQVFTGRTANTTNGNTIAAAIQISGNAGVSVSATMSTLTAPCTTACTIAGGQMVRPPSSNSQANGKDMTIARTIDATAIGHGKFQNNNR